MDSTTVIRNYLPATAAIVIALIALFFAVPAAQAVEDDVVSVSGSAELMTEPDQVEVLVTVESHDTAVSAAQDDNRQRSDAVLQALQDSGITTDQLETVDYRVQRVEPDREALRNVTEYRVINTIMVTSNDTSAAGSIIDTAIGAGADRIDGVRFDLTDRTRQQIRERALSRAADVAASKARSLASDLGITIGAPVGVTESAFDLGRYDLAYDESKATPGTTITPQEIAVTATVSVDYRIR